ncbi:unnamed protein product [Lathyrus sativus]|nr:unnamed protein product [Lathyrus sativus]
MKTLILLILTLFIIHTFSHAAPILITQLQLQMNHSSMLNHTQQHINETRLMSRRGGYRDCSYLITIKTSCDSPRYSKDHIGLLFGDAIDSEIYVPRLDGPDSGPFRKCRTMSFDVKAPEPCMGGICKLYLFRNGTDGWMPETVTAYDYHYPPVIFNYNFFLSEGPGVGHNYCGKS